LVGRLLQVVTSHAVKVSVTEQLNVDVAGYLPAHCIYHLLRSRTFTKHQVCRHSHNYNYYYHLTALCPGLPG